MMMQRSMWVLLFSAMSMACWCQQASQFSQYMLNKYQSNPAYGGMDRSLSITAANRNQWSGFDGRPTNQHINATIPYYRVNGAFGLSIDNETIGALSQTALNASFNFVQDISFGLISIGASLGIEQRRLDGTKIITPDGIYEGNIINHNDLILSNAQVNGISPKWSFGTYFINELFEIGLSIGDLPSVNSSSGEFNFNKSVFSNAYFEYRYRFSDRLDLQPSVLVKTDFVEWQTDLVALAYIDRQYMAGIGVRGYHTNSLDAVILLAGYQINKNYRLSYSYDLGISSLSNQHAGTHEFVLNYNLQKLIGQAVPTQVIYSPRFL